jgi:hypothetical protein
MHVGPLVSNVKAFISHLSAKTIIDSAERFRQLMFQMGWVAIEITSTAFVFLGIVGFILFLAWQTKIHALELYKILRP